MLVLLLHGMALEMFAFKGVQAYHKRTLMAVLFVDCVMK